MAEFYTNPASHGEGRFVASEEVLKQLFANGQVATQYCDLDGTVTMDEEWNPMVLTVRSKESQVRMDVCLVRWLTQNEEEIGCSQYLRRTRSEDLRIWCCILQINNEEESQSEKLLDFTEHNIIMSK